MTDDVTDRRPMRLLAVVLTGLWAVTAIAIATAYRPGGPIDILVALRSAHENAKGHVMGVDVFTGKIVDMHEKGVVEPIRVKEQAVKSAAEAASMILRIDDVIASTAGGKAPEAPRGEEEGEPEF